MKNLLMKLQNKRNEKKGFTLVELLVVIAILAILASVSVVGYLGFTQKAKDSNAATELAQAKTVLRANLLEGKDELYAFEDEKLYLLADSSSEEPTAPTDTAFKDHFVDLKDLDGTFKLTVGSVKGTTDDDKINNKYAWAVTVEYTVNGGKATW